MGFYVNNTISCPTLTHCPVKSARSPSQCFFSYMGVVTITMSYGHILRLVPVVPIVTRSAKNLGYCDEIRVQKDCLIFCRIVNNLANIEYKVNKAVVGMHICDFCH